MRELPPILRKYAASASVHLTLSSHGGCPDLGLRPAPTRAACSAASGLGALQRGMREVEKVQRWAGGKVPTDTATQAPEWGGASEKWSI